MQSTDTKATRKALTGELNASIESARYTDEQCQKKMRFKDAKDEYESMRRNHWKTAAMKASKAYTLQREHRLPGIFECLPSLFGCVPYIFIKI